jgi:hypothetical protein
MNLPGNPSISQSGDTLVSSSAAGNQWYRNNMPIPGASAQSYLPVQDGCYSVLVTDTNGCSSAPSDTVCVSPVVLGIVSGKDSGKITIVPNPFRQQTVITVYSRKQRRITMQVYDMLGRQVRILSGRENEGMTLERKDLQAGLYFYTLTGAENLPVTGKLIIE